jgi:hypothetical protein
MTETATLDMLVTLPPGTMQLRLRTGADEAPAIETAPREPDTSMMLFCPDQGGWHVGEWWNVEEPGRWVASIDVSLTRANRLGSPGRVCWKCLRLWAPMSRLQFERAAKPGAKFACLPP